MLGSLDTFKWYLPPWTIRPTLNLLLAFNAFSKHGRSSTWCKAHALSFRAMSRAVSIRSQLKKYMQRFKLPLDSCEGDAKRLRRCLVSGYWRNGARWVADGTYRSVRGDKVNSLMQSDGVSTDVFARFCMYTRLRCYLPGNPVVDGWSFMKWKKPRKLSRWKTEQLTVADFLQNSDPY